MSHTLVRRAVFACAALLTLSGCGGSPETRILTLDFAPPRRASGVVRLRSAIRIGSIHLPETFDRITVVRQSLPNQLSVDDFAHWAAPLPDLVRSALTQDLESRTAAGSIVYPNISVPVEVPLVSVDILSLQASGDQMVMDVSWDVAMPARSADAGARGSGVRTIRLTATVADSGSVADAAAFSALVGQLADDVAAVLAMP